MQRTIKTNIGYITVIAALAASHDLIVNANNLAKYNGIAITNAYFNRNVAVNTNSVQPPSDLTAHTQGYYENSIITDFGKELNEFLNGERALFTVPASFSGTEFQKSVWQAIIKIPYGAVSTYGDLAQMIGRFGAARAVGTACKNNPIAIYCPCHRVLSSSLTPKNYFGGVDAQIRLLKLEADNRERLNL